MKYTALILLLVSTVPMTYCFMSNLKSYLFYSSSIDFESFWSDLTDATVFSAVFIVPAAILLIESTRFSKWLTPIVPTSCPRCGHDAQHLVEARCPECGLEMPKCLVSETIKDK